VEYNPPLLHLQYLVEALAREASCKYKNIFYIYI
jgi:hypothetical protein